MYSVGDNSYCAIVLLATLHTNMYIRLCVYTIINSSWASTATHHAILEHVQVIWSKSSDWLLGIKYWRAYINVLILIKGRLVSSTGGRTSMCLSLLKVSSIFGSTKPHTTDILTMITLNNL